jgi:hypothetical protein
MQSDRNSTTEKSVEFLCKGLFLEYLRLRRPWIMDQGFVSLDRGQDDILPIFILGYGWQAQSGDPCPGGRTLPHLQAQTLGSPEYFRVPKGCTGDTELMVELVGIGGYAEVACEHKQAGQTSIDLLGWLSRSFRCHSWFSLLLRLREHLPSL